ncbi:MAG: cofactor-independent phosphoglycerate mutase [Candidatus Hydrogenedentes bacterium]|nr:cofactor-independent phosphoglycerate mutase [Candidatus Hydrogenedentota bacterium]
MKYLVLLGDGMADFPLEECGGHTPLFVAQTPAMDQAAREGICALFCPIPEAYPAGSDIGNLSVFGYDPAQTFTGRAPLEAVNQGIDLGRDKIAFRCNLVTLQDDRMADFTAGHISSEEAAELIGALNESLGGTDLHFNPGVSYRHLTIVTPEPDAFDRLTALRCTPPHDIIDQSIAAHLPSGNGSEYVVGLMERSRKILNEHPVNKARRDAGQSPATSIWLWGQGGAPSMKTFPERFGLQGAVISAVDLVNGIGRCAGLEVIHVPGATGYLDTDYAGKVDAALTALETVDFVYLHVEAPDEAGHEGNAELKIRAIEDFDAKVVAPCLRYAAERGDLRILIAPDHVTSVASRTHAGGPVPFVLWGTDIEANACATYSEEAAAACGVLFPKGHELVPRMLDAQRILAQARPL